MDSERFDRWTKLLAQPRSRRAALAALGAAAAGLATPHWTLGQDDDDDQSDDPAPNDDGQPDDQDDQHDNNSTTDEHEDRSDDDSTTDVPGRLGWGNPCLPIVTCKKFVCIDSVNNVDGTGLCFYNLVGPIPGGPYEQEIVFAIPPCQPKDRTVRELEALCTQAYPGNEDHACGDGTCEACASFALVGCS